MFVFDIYPMVMSFVMYFDKDVKKYKSKGKYR